MEQQKSYPERKSPRAKWHNYNGGEYFVTICTQNREHFFGEIINGEMHLSEIGAWADEQLRNISSHYPYAEMPLWVVMPNHIHTIVIIDGTQTPVRTMCTSSLRGNESVNKRMQTISYKRGLLSTTIGGLKRAVTRFANQNNIPFAWQTRFHDHIVRNQNEMNHIADYIENNVAQWGADVFGNNQPPCL
ncbi:MAG: transposase [Paludibacteraceae bacterium]|nr:transposase [Paludibacteraceae bacterium]